MIFPSDRNQSLKKFGYAHYIRPLVDLTNISFTNNGYTYILFSDDVGDIKPPVIERGVRVTAPGANGKETTLLCEPGFVSQKWDVLESVLPCDAKVADQMGSGCPGK